MSATDHAATAAGTTTTDPVTATSASAPPPGGISELWFTRCPVPTATSIAYDQGWLADEFAADGIGIASLQDERGASLRESHFTHDLPTLIREGGNVPALWARSRGAATRLIGLTWVDEYQAILAAPGSSISSPIGLAGQRLALPDRGGSIDFWRAMALRGHHAALAVAGLHPDDVSYVDVPGPNASTRRADGTVDHHASEVEALRNGSVDAIYVKGAPGLEVARRLGGVEVIDLGSHPDPAVRINNGTPRPITVDERLLLEHGDLVARFLGVLTRTADWASSRPEQVAEVVAAETGAGGVTRAYRDLHRHLDIDLSPERVAALIDQKDFLLAHGFLDGDVDVEAWIAPEPLAARRGARKTDR